MRTDKTVGVGVGQGGTVVKKFACYEKKENRIVSVAPGIGRLSFGIVDSSAVLI